MLADIILRHHARLKTESRVGDYRTENKFKWLLCGLYTKTSGFFIFLCYKVRYLFRIYPDPLDWNGNLIVSFTSFPKRMKNLWMTVDMMMRQTCRPARIYLYLAASDFPNREKDLPESLLPYMERGLAVLFTEEDLRSHLKYHYAFKNEAEGRRRLVVTLDDDLFYPSDVIERLVSLHEEHPCHVCANIARRITFHEDGSFRPYSEWEDIMTACPASAEIIALGFGGVLYPYECYSNMDSVLFDIGKMKSLSYKADDLWLKAVQLTEGTPVATGDYSALPPSVPFTQGISLSRTNCGGKTPGNDLAWAALDREFGLSGIITQGGTQSHS